MVEPNIVSKTDFIQQLVISKRWRFLRHFILALVVFSNFEVFDVEGCKYMAKVLKVSVEQIFVCNFSKSVAALLLIYINLYYLFPKFLKKGKYLFYGIGLLVLLVLLFLVLLFFDVYLFDFSESELESSGIYFAKGFVQTMTYPFVFLGSTTGYKFFKTWLQDQQRFSNLQQEKVKAELNQLKNQVNPHFLFNTLNNLNVLISLNPEKASQLTLGLSDVLRYQIYDSQFDEVILQKEIDLIEQYLELEKIRRDNLNANINIIGNVKGAMVPPLLFINFIDNAIKHSNTQGEALINISFELKEGFLFFIITNTKVANNQKEQKGGFGLSNVIKRLELLYKNNYTLNIIDTDKLYTIELKFPI